MAVNERWKKKNVAVAQAESRRKYIDTLIDIQSIIFDVLLMKSIKIEMERYTSIYIQYKGTRKWDEDVRYGKYPWLNSSVQSEVINTSTDAYAYAHHQTDLLKEKKKIKYLLDKVHISVKLLYYLIKWKRKRKSSSKGFIFHICFFVFRHHVPR